VRYNTPIAHVYTPIRAPISLPRGDIGVRWEVAIRFGDIGPAVAPLRDDAHTDIGCTVPISVRAGRLRYGSVTSGRAVAPLRDEMSTDIGVHFTKSGSDISLAATAAQPLCRHWRHCTSAVRFLKPKLTATKPKFTETDTFSISHIHDC
jgi:hypothetical protein